MSLEASGVHAAEVPATTATPADAPLPKFTLFDLVGELARVQALVDADESQFDPEVILGIKLPEASPSKEECDRVVDMLRAKVDGIEYVIDEFESYAKRATARAQVHSRRAQAAKRRAERLETYTLRVMEIYGFTKLPGADRVAEVRYASNPSLVVDREPTAEDVLNETLAPYVEEVPASYVWKAEPLKRALKDGGKFSFASLYKKPRLHFDDRDAPAVKERKPKGKKA